MTVLPGGAKEQVEFRAHLQRLWPCHYFDRSYRVLSYEITNISLQFDVVTNPDLARRKRQQYVSQTVVLYTRVLRHRKLAFNKRDVTWNINLNTPAQRNAAAL